MNKLLISVFTILSLGACSMGGTIEISEPKLALSDKQLSFHDGILQLDDISISIKPTNYFQGLLTAGPLLFPIIPLGHSGETVRAGQDFEVAIQFEPSTDGFKFSPENVELHSNNEVLMPKSAAGLLTEIYPAREHHASIPGHPWTCFENYSFVDPLILKETEVGKGCFVLRFDIETLNPDQNFSLKVKGLTRNGDSVEIPIFNFEKDDRGVFFLLM